jgi:hypothetical protein
MKLCTAKNTGSFTGTHETSKYFLSSISKVDVLSRADKLGVSLGGSPGNMMDTINLIKSSDNLRMLIMLTKNLEEKMVKLDESKNFSFELSWLKKEGFIDIVSQERISVPHDNNPIVNWHNKIQHL